MTPVQKFIAVCTIGFNTFFFHVEFCEWATGSAHQFLAKESRSNIPNDYKLIISVGPLAGIYARTKETLAVDAILGVAVPVTLIGLGLFLFAGNGVHMNEVQSTLTNDFKHGTEWSEPGSFQGNSPCGNPETSYDNQHSVDDLSVN